MRSRSPSSHSRAKIAHRNIHAREPSGSSHSLTSAELHRQLDVAAWARGVLAGLAGQLTAAERARLQAQIDDIGREPAAAPPPDPSRPVIVRDVDELQTLNRRLDTADVVVVDLETSDLNPRKGTIVGIGVAAVDGAAYIPVNHAFESTNTLLPGQLPLTQALQELRLQDRRLVGHNVKFETRWLRHHGGIEPAFVWDTMIAARLLRSDLAADLETLAMRELDVPQWSLPANEISRIQFLSVDRVAAYCGKDVWHTLALYRKQIECLV
jgi:hypothetical protein